MRDYSIGWTGGPEKPVSQWSTHDLQMFMEDRDDWYDFEPDETVEGVEERIRIELLLRARGLSTA